MKTHIYLRERSRPIFIGIALFLAAFAMRSEAQYAITWYKVAGGGGASSNAPYVVNGTSDSMTPAAN